MAAADEQRRSMTDDEWMEVSNLIWPNPDYVDEDQLLEVRLLWFNQSLRFATNTVGFDQPKNGPCGALSGLQAMLLRHYLFDHDLANEYNQMVRTSDETLFAFIETGGKEALARGIASSLWRAATMRLEHKIGVSVYDEAAASFVAGGARLVLPVAGAFVDPLTHSAADFVVLSADSKAALTGLVRTHLDQFVVEGGVILFLYSLMLSRGNVLLRRDLNDQYGSCRFILDGWGFCGQALVNLIIGGMALSDVSGVVEYSPDVPQTAVAAVAPPVVEEQAVVDVIEVISRQQVKGQPGQYEYEVTYRRPAGEAVPPPRSGEKWRCLACTTKVPVEWNAWNDATATQCKECQRPLQECGRCIWIPFARLSANAQRDVETRYGKSAATLATPSSSTTTTGAVAQTYHMVSEQIGFLTSEAPVGPHLQNPQLPIWIVHGGAHYTTLFCTDADFARSEEERMIAVDRTPNPVHFWHFNGLPPGGPRMSTFVCTWEPPLHLDAMHDSAGGSAENERPLDVERLIARRQAVDGNWEYEVVAEPTTPVPALLDPAAPRSSHATADFYEADIYSPPKNGATWRCLACTTATVQVWSAINPASAPVCKECNRPLTETGRCLWLRYARLPFGKQRQVDRDYAPAILQVIHTKYAGVYLEFEDGPEPSI